MMQGVVVRYFDAPPVSLREVLRYAGVRGEADATLSALLTSCLGEVGEGLSYRVCYAVHPVTVTADGVDLGYIRVPSSDLGVCLSGCSRALTFVATVGPLPDRMVARYGNVSPTKALLHQAIGAERIEALCDAFETALQNEQGFTLRPRFSPGYGDLPLGVQRDIFRILSPERHIGVTLSEALLMVPSKSVAAIIGITNAKKES